MKVQQCVRLLVLNYNKHKIEDTIFAGKYYSYTVNISSIEYIKGLLCRRCLYIIDEQAKRVRHFHRGIQIDILCM